MQKLLKKIKTWWEKHIADTVPEHLNDIF